jgi:hypothetical protein
MSLLDSAPTAPIAHTNRHLPETDKKKYQRKKLHKNILIISLKGLQVAKKKTNGV